MTATLLLLLGLAIGAALGWLVTRTRLDPVVARLSLALEHEHAATAEKVALLEEARDGLSATFKALSADALSASSASFLQLAKVQLEQLHTRASGDLQQRQQAVEHLVQPIQESLEKVGREVRTLEQSRRQDYGSLSSQLRALAETNERLRSETGNLVTALRAPDVRGRWGEMQLRRAVETAGMLAHCDFVEQVTAFGEEGRLRPDLVVKLPGGRNVVVDAKAPLQPLLDALAAKDDETRAALLSDFGRHVREHVAKLSGKAYWAQFSPTPDFVVMFLPGESFFRAALEQDPSLLELTASDRVIMASPTTLITLLRAVAVGWREERVTESARAVNELGRELYERLSVLTDHFALLGKRLNGAVQAYNQTVGSLERRVLVSARRFPEHGIGSAKELASAIPIETTAQPPQTVELPRASEELAELPGPAAADAA
jgi:DNA recombination protein RmuC